MAFRVEITPLAQQPTVAWCYSIAVHEIRVEDIVAVEWNDGPITDRLLSVVVTFKNGERKGYVGEELAWVVPQIKYSFPSRRSSLLSDAYDKLRDQNTDQREIALPEDLRATWDEEENLRPTIQGDADPLTGNGVLRYTKDKRRRRLDELDAEPE
jgi:hypothetical protein